MDTQSTGGLPSIDLELKDINKTIKGLKDSLNYNFESGVVYNLHLTNGALNRLAMSTEDMRGTLAKSLVALTQTQESLRRSQRLRDGILVFVAIVHVILLAVIAFRIAT